MNLIAYNQWDPRSLRVGCKNCEITVTTDKGTVKVTRGKDNIWDVTPKGGKTEHYKSIGKKILPEAADILGLKVVKLGDTEMPVNIVDQLEKHFMLAELGGKDVSGSARAQIIDEISGLTGIETLIRDVSLDNTRNARAIKSQEESAGAIKEKLHDQDELDREKAALNEAKSLYDDANDKREITDAMVEFYESYELVQEKIDDIVGKLDAMPDLEMASAQIEQAQNACDRANDMRTYFKQIEQLRRLAGGVSAKIKVLPDEAEAQTLIESARENIEKISAFSGIIDEHSRLSIAIAVAEQKIESGEKELQEAEDEYASILSTCTVCPYSGRPIDTECFRHIKVPVRSVEEAKELERKLGL